MEFHLREPVLADASVTSRLRHAAWRDTYDLASHVWAKFTPEAFLERDRAWIGSYEDAADYPTRIARVAEADGEILGLAVSGPGRDAGFDIARELYSMYVLPRVQGSGVAAALMGAVLPRGVAAYLWVADRNPRAQGFYRKHGFRTEGRPKVDEELEIDAIRMVRREG